MIVYFDTSALIKRYFTESDSPAVVDLWARATLIAASQITYAEMLATFARKSREQSPQNMAAEGARDAFRADWEGFERIAVDADVNRWVDVVLARYPLRGADSIHLASSLRLRELMEDQVVFACADVALSLRPSRKAFSPRPKRAGASRLGVAVERRGGCGLYVPRSQMPRKSVGGLGRDCAYASSA